MSEIIDNPLVPVTFKTVFEQDKIFFYQLRSRKGNTLHETFNLLINKYKDFEKGNLNGSQANDNKDLQNKINQDATKIIELEITISQLQEKIKELEDALKNSVAPETIEKIIEPSSPAFVFTPGPETAKNLKRLFALKLRDGKLQKTQDGLKTFLNSTTEKSINYYIKDNYSEILK